MKKIFRYLNIATLFIALSAMFTSCKDFDGNDSGNAGLSIKVFAPTVVVPGFPMTINGSGFNDVTEIEFPGGIKVTEPDFEIITDEMIRVKAPGGLNQEGPIKVTNKAGETAVSRLPLAVGNTVITGYFPLNKENDEYKVLKGNELLTIYGKDMQFVTGAEFIDEDNNIIHVFPSEFIRVAPGRVVIQVPAKVLTGIFPVKIHIGNQVVETPEYQFETAKNAGHWETTKRYIWENPGLGDISWNGTYRFANEENKSGEECHAFTMDEWDIIKNGEVFFEFTPSEASNIRITTGWWSAAYGGADHNCIDKAEPGDNGNMVIKLNINEEHTLYDLIDAQHLLFTGSDYYPVGIYVEDKVWVEGEGGHLETVKTSFWENGKQSTIPAPSWSGEGRFACVTNSTGEETYAFSEEEWQVLKSEPFRIKIESLGSPNVRVTTGWWSTAYGGGEYNCFDIAEPVPNEEGKYFIELNLASYPELLDAVDAQHLLFTGSDYKLLEIYQEKEEWVGGDEAGGEVIIWEGDGSAGAIDWNGVYRFCNEEHKTGEEIFAIPMDQWDVIKNGSFWLHAKGSDWVQMRITTGWWSTTWTGADITTGDERIITNDDGTYDIEICFKGDPIVDVLDDQHLLFTGGGYTPLKLYYKK